MKVTEQSVRYVADLANLELTSAERERMLRDLNNILEYIDRLNALDTTDVPPMAQTLTQVGADSNRSSSAGFAQGMREDKTTPSLPHEAAVQNAPQTDGTYFQVPKVIER